MTDGQIQFPAWLPNVTANIFTANIFTAIASQIEGRVGIADMNDGQAVGLIAVQSERPLAIAESDQPEFLLITDPSDIDLSLPYVAHRQEASEEDGAAGGGLRLRLEPRWSPRRRSRPVRTRALRRRVGQGHGLHGQSCAIDTMSGRSVMLGEIVAFAKVHPELSFLVTEVGCGIAGYGPEDVAPTFRGVSGNVALPESFAELLADHR